MAVNKNFVVKNGLEVNNQLLFADATNNKVGIASTQPNVELDVRGGIAATNTTVSGVSTVQTELRVGAGIAGTVFTVLGNDSLVGVGTSVPAYILDVRAPVSTGQTALYVQGDARITGDINIDDITLDYADITHMVVGAASTFSGDLDINADIDVDGTSFLDELDVTGLSTFRSNVDIDADVDVNNSVSITQGLSVTGISTFTGLVDINGGADVTGVSTFTDNIDANASIELAGGLSVVGMSTFTGIGTFDTVYATEARTRKSYPQELEVTGISSLGNVKIFSSGNAGIITATDPSTGIVTYYGDGQFLQNIVSGVGIASTDPNTGISSIVGLGATIITFAGPGISTTAPITVDTASGIATITFQGGGGSGTGGYQTNIVKDSFTVGASGTDTFTATNSYATGMLDVFINGSRLAASDFTETDADNGIVTLDSAAVEGDIVELVNFLVVAITGDFETQIIKEEFTVTAATQSVFDLANTYGGGYLDVYLNGVKLSSSDFTETDTDTITLTTAAKLGDIVEVVNFKKRAISDYAEMWADNYNVSGIHTNSPVGVGTSVPGAFVDIHGGLNVVGVTTLGGNLVVTGAASTSSIAGALQLTNANVSGISTLSIGGAGASEAVYFQSKTQPQASLKISQAAGNDHGILMTFTSFDGDTATIETDSNSNLIIDTSSTLNLRANTNNVLQSSGESARLFYSGTEKLTTTGAGVTITGICSATSFSGSGANLTDLNIPSGFNELDAALFN
tara:strand:- start:257 stop:2485 length:2229 start_codon:yes stop_codon:yes gene_type:complete